MMIPRLLSVALGTAVALAVTGCMGGGSPAPSNGEIGGDLSVVFDSNYRAALEPAVADFRARHPGVNLEIDYTGGDILGTVSTQLQAGTAPDIFLTLPGGTPHSGGGMTSITLGSQDLVLDLSDSSWAADIPPPWNEDVEWNGGVWAYPGALQGIGPIYNVTRLEELGLQIPDTWDGLLQLCRDARARGVTAYAAGLNDAAHMVYLAISSTLVYGPDPDFNRKQLAGEVTFQNSAWRDVFQAYLHMNEAGCFPEGALGATRVQAGELVAGGQALAVTDVGAALAVLRNTNPNNQYVLTAFPATNNPDEHFITALPGYTISVNAETDNPATAKAFIEVLHEHVSEYALGFSSVPVIPVEGFAPPAGLEQFNAAVENGRTTKLPNWPGAELQPFAISEVQAILLGQETIETALIRMQQLFDQST